MRDIAVILSVYSIDRANDLFACIQSLKAQTFQPKEIIVVLDNNSELVSYYASYLKAPVKLVVSDGFGLSQARNTGV